MGWYLSSFCFFIVHSFTLVSFSTAHFREFQATAILKWQSNNYCCILTDIIDIKLWQDETRPSCCCTSMLIAFYVDSNLIFLRFLIHTKTEKLLNNSRSWSSQLSKCLQSAVAHTLGYRLKIHLKKIPRDEWKKLFCEVLDSDLRCMYVKCEGSDSFSISSSASWLTIISKFFILPHTKFSSQLNESDSASSKQPSSVYELVYHVPAFEIRSKVREREMIMMHDAILNMLTAPLDVHRNSFVAPVRFLLFSFTTCSI